MGGALLSVESNTLGPVIFEVVLSGDRLKFVLYSDLLCPFSEYPLSVFDYSNIAVHACLILMQIRHLIKPKDSLSSAPKPIEGKWEGASDQMRGFFQRLKSVTEVGVDSKETATGSGESSGSIEQDGSGLGRNLYSSESGKDEDKTEMRRLLSSSGELNHKADSGNRTSAEIRSFQVGFSESNGLGYGGNEKMKIKKTRHFTEGFSESDSLGGEEVTSQNARYSSSREANRLERTALAHDVDIEMESNQEEVVEIDSEQVGFGYSDDSSLHEPSDTAEPSAFLAREQSRPLLGTKRKQGSTLGRKTKGKAVSKQKGKVTTTGKNLV